MTQIRPIHNLITDFQNSAKEVVDIFKKVYDVNNILEGWHRGVYDQTGKILSEGVTFYACHGIGIAAHFADKKIDFDFAYMPELRYDGFDLSRLVLFAESMPEKYDDLLSNNQIEIAFEQLKEENLIYNPLATEQTHNYFWVKDLDKELIIKDQISAKRLKKPRWKFW